MAAEHSAPADWVRADLARVCCSAARLADDHSVLAALLHDCLARADLAAADLTRAYYSAERRADDSAQADLSPDEGWGVVPAALVPVDCWAARKADDHSSPAALPDDCWAWADLAATDSVRDDCSVAERADDSVAPERAHLAARLQLAECSDGSRPGSREEPHSVSQAFLEALSGPADGPGRQLLAANSAPRSSPMVVPDVVPVLVAVWQMAPEGAAECSLQLLDGSPPPAAAR